MNWICLNCLSLSDLDVHGRCPRCRSDAVDIAVRPPARFILPEGRKQQIETLEALMKGATGAGKGVDAQ